MSELSELPELKKSAFDGARQPSGRAASWGDRSAVWRDSSSGRCSAPWDSLSHTRHFMFGWTVPTQRLTASANQINFLNKILGFPLVWHKSLTALLRVNSFTRWKSWKRSTRLCEHTCWWASWLVSTAASCGVKPNPVINQIKAVCARWVGRQTSESDTCWCLAQTLSSNLDDYVNTSQLETSQRN